MYLSDSTEYSQQEENIKHEPGLSSSVRKKKDTMQGNLKVDASVIQFLRNACWKVKVPAASGLQDSSTDRVIEDGMHCISCVSVCVSACVRVNGGHWYRDGGRKRRQFP